jgi:tetratricopeptide (TPR) repeat protein
MRLPPRLFGAAIFTLTSLIAAPAFAEDAVKAEGLKYSDGVSVIGIANGKLLTRIKGKDRSFDLDKVDWLSLENQPIFNKAEDARKDAKAAAALYKSCIPNFNDRKLKVVAELRAVGPLDADGKYTDAVNCFLDAYQYSPTESVWNLRPTSVPPASSTMLKESATKIETRASQFTATDARKNLKTWELELLTKARDPAAPALARELNGTAEPGANPAAPAPAAPEAAPAAAVGAGLQGVANAVNAKQYDAAIAQADRLLGVATGDTAVRLFELKAKAYEGKQNLAEAAANYLRIAAHYPSNAAAPESLYRAAELQKQLKHDDEAKRLFKEIVEAYPNSATAIKAKPQM